MANSRKIAFLYFLSLVTLCSFVFYYDNTDRNTRSMKTDDAQFMMFTASNPEFHQALFDEDTADNDEFPNDNSTEQATNICLKDPNATGSTKQQLESFTQGECAPVIVLPGLLGTKLVAEINCEVLQEKNPEIMEACGWNTCNAWNLFGSKPDSEYIIWVAHLHASMSVFSITDNKCFGSLIEFTHPKTKLTLERYGKVEGISITWYGNTPKTYSDAAAGFSAISDIMPLPFQLGGSAAFKNLDKRLTNIGYQKGLSLFAIPYDFRLTYLAGTVQYTLERTIRYAYELTGKKVVIVAHSLGNINTLPVLTNMNQEDKDRMIAAYVAVTPPYGGAAKPVKLFMGGEKELLFGGIYGVQYFNQKSFFSTSASFFDIMPGDSFYRFRDETWMKEMLQRVELEQKYNIKTKEGAEFWAAANKNDLPLSFFPNPSEMCFKGYTKRPEECRTLITDLAAQPIAKINGDNYYANASSIQAMLDKYYYLGNLTTALESYNDSLANGVHRFTNPGVPVVYIYGSHVSTDSSCEWDYDPSDKTSYDEFASPSKTNKDFGDATVAVSYALPIALKWAWEHRNKVSNAKPIKVVEYCSNNSVLSSVWDTISKNGTRIMNKTAYMGMPCTCWTNSPKDGATCNHGSIVSDALFIDMVAEISNTAETLAEPKKTAAFKLSEESLAELIKTLPHLRKPRTDQDPMKWLYPEETEPKTLLEQLNTYTKTIKRALIF